MYTMADYETKAINLYLNVGGQATEKLFVSGSLSFNTSTSEYEQVIMPDVSSRVIDTQGDPDLTHSDFTFGEMHTYSDLDYTIMHIAGGVEYTLSEGLTWTADADYADMTDDAGYVYGIEDGSVFFVRTGFRFDF